MEHLHEEWHGIAPPALDDAELEDLLCHLAQVRAGLDALGSVALAELDRRGCHVTGAGRYRVDIEAASRGRRLPAR